MHDENKGERLIFVGGSPRSGTTMLQNILDSHDDICGGPEFLHLPDVINLRAKLHNSITCEFIDLFCSHKDVDKYISSFIEKLLLPLADKQKCKFLSEKTPENVLVFSELIELFPRAHYIHVVRDPRAIISSMQQVKKRAINKGLKPPAFTANILSSIQYTKRCMNAGFTASKNAPDKVLTVVYERLVADLENETKTICGFLGIEWTSQMLYPASKKHLGEKAITSKSHEIWYDTKMYYRNPDEDDLNKWKKQLTLTQQIIITKEFSANKELKQLGYNLLIDNLTGKKQIHFYTKVALFKYYFYQCMIIAKKITCINGVKRIFT